MNEREKAKELIVKYRKFAKYWDCYHDTELPTEDILSDCKNMALLAVYEIVKALRITTGHCELRRLDQHEVQKDLDYWDRVISEINISTPELLNTNK